MIIKRSREHLVNLANYESVRVGAEVTLEDADIRELRKRGADIYSDANRVLDELLADDLKEAAANVPENAQTHLDTWKQ